MRGNGAWLLPVESDLHGVFSRLTDLGTAWAARRGWDWHVVLNNGDRPADGPLHRFRWQVVTEAVRFAAGRVPAPPTDYAALPLGLRELLAWAVPAALADGPSGAPDLARSRSVALEAHRLATELSVSGAVDGVRRVALGLATGSAIEFPPGARAPAKAASVPKPGSSLADPADLLAAALTSSAPARLPAGAAEALARLRAAPLPLSDLRSIADGHGLLPGTLLDALDAVAVRVMGSPATRVECHVVHLHPEYAAALARGEDPLA